MIIIKIIQGRSKDTMHRVSCSVGLSAPFAVSTRVWQGCFFSIVSHLLTGNRLGDAEGEDNNNNFNT